MPACRQAEESGSELLTTIKIKDHLAFAGWSFIKNYKMLRSVE